MKRAIKPTRELFAAVLLTLCAAGCASSGAQQAGPQQSVNDDHVVVLVENGEHSDARVYAVRGNLRIPLGVVTAASRKTFRLEKALLAPDGAARFEIVPLVAVGMSRPFVTEAVRPHGDAVRILIMGPWSMATLVSRESVSAR